MKNLILILAVTICSVCIFVGSVKGNRKGQPEEPTGSSVGTGEENSTLQLLQYPVGPEYKVVSRVEFAEYREFADNAGIEPFINEYFLRWKEGGMIPASEDVIEKWNVLYGDRTFAFESYKSSAYVEKYMDEDGKLYYSLPFRLVQILWQQEESCALEAVALGYKHLIVLTKGEGSWKVIKDIGCSDMYAGYNAEDLEEVMSVYRHAAGLLNAGLTEEDIEEAREAAKRAFITMPVYFGTGIADDEERISSILPVLSTDEFSAEVNAERIAEYIFSGHLILEDVPMVILNITAKEAFTVERTYSPEEILNYPMVVVIKQDGVWKSHGIAVKY